MHSKVKVNIQMGAEAKRYLNEHGIPQLFEGLMTGLIYNKPENPLEFLEGALARIRKNPELALKWDSFVDSSVPPAKLQSNGEENSKNIHLANFGALNCTC
ncbi:hypothetical protein M3Y96_00197700 [Aphelenchoides besseyi]|nr:hypothetical protein M3Y96_00197700 [Aphelenchoides besseyi]